MRILIAESKWTGHHLFFAAGIAEALADGDHEITLAVTNSGEENARRMVDLAVAGLPRNISIRPSLPGPPSGFARIGDRDGAIERTTIERETLAAARARWRVRTRGLSRQQGRGGEFEREALAYSKGAVLRWRV